MFKLVFFSAPHLSLAFWTLSLGSIPHISLNTISSYSAGSEARVKEQETTIGQRDALIVELRAEITRLEAVQRIIQQALGNSGSGGGGRT